jgi:hypothetical protein
MVAASSNRVAWVYSADNGTDYRVAAVKDMTDQDKQGGKAYTNEPAKPASIKMRRITVTTAAGASRVIPVYSLDADILTEGASVNVNVLGTMTAATSSGNPIPENHVRKSVTRQAS